MTGFQLWPAIDLKEGKAVRLLRGDMNTAKTYADDPAQQAWTFRDAGFDRLHIVDLDGAFAGKPANAEAVERILRETDATVQLGGGIRDLQTAERWLKLGVTRVILGTAAVKNPEFARQAAEEFPNRVVIGLDAKDGFVATEGWDEASQVTAEEVAKRFEDAPVAAIVYTDIARDGALEGPNIEATRALARTTPIPIIASGGISCAEDITALSECYNDGVIGTIIGKALYEGRVTPLGAREAVKA
ncbi:1-(5-phosphoribosyl)-5-[(5-phosphoribosylamino)methylideneamino]imidazole-4-carboxamide isomerase [Parvularcula lutaonensis]|uniref:1-(5-phosphoribosyl)-5-[(5-phosphoribosylamino)methylideneamino] imidazole-4-carboxamide isomerase n=1 Tax=Parvularcula lutaonensis TaxID=491923 RepID=A0ABV7MGA3_9PROT|nr:1-(5-phosphoribosyl)-5-[(5-phosphoribosylamino)methylideneamino]imidazole-4-carboxamide isomerase [Parvularcula lutaonensis]GGY51691.1 1-(5-phosphoribosyl)-5-[(5-phosphoribosylamino) methylideneamino] imidazole-4-carboxamide isomerase [Parvularcula lutaonensis]